MNLGLIFIYQSGSFFCEDQFFLLNERLTVQRTERLSRRFTEFDSDSNVRMLKKVCDRPLCETDGRLFRQQLCWSSQDVGRVQEVLGDNTHGAIQLADPPAVNVVLLADDINKISSLEGQLVRLVRLAVP